MTELPTVGLVPRPVPGHLRCDLDGNTSLGSFKPKPPGPPVPKFRPRVAGVSVTGVGTSDGPVCVSEEVAGSHSTKLLVAFLRSGVRPPPPLWRFIVLTSRTLRPFPTSCLSGEDPSSTSGLSCLLLIGVSRRSRILTSTFPLSQLQGLRSSSTVSSDTSTRMRRQGQLHNHPAPDPIVVPGDLVQ